MKLSSIFFAALFVIILIYLISLIIWSNRSSHYTNNVSLLRKSTNTLLRPVKNFDIVKYQGLWYEQRRLPNSFETNLVDVTAEYTLLDNGFVQVLNRGINKKTGVLSEAKGLARTTTTPGVLMVSFSKLVPFIEASYVVLYVDKHYTTAIVTSTRGKDLWLLTRNKHATKEQLSVYKKFLKDVN